MRRALTLVCGALLATSLAFADENKTHSSGGQSAVRTHAGAFTYSVPIRVPPFHGVEPKLGLEYTSNGRNGWVGVGWRLTGWPVIDRVSPRKGAPSFDGTDVFTLDGEELIPCAPGMVSPSCATGGTHATKRESFGRIKYDASSDAWTLTQRDGLQTILRPTFVATNANTNCQPISITGGVSSGGVTLSALEAWNAGRQINYYSGANGETKGVVAPFTLSGFTASGGGQRPRWFSHVLIGKGNRLELYEGAALANTLTLNGAVAYGQIFGSNGIYTLRASGTQMSCSTWFPNAYESFPCSGKIDFFGTNCSSSSSVAGAARWGIAEVVDTRNNSSKYTWECIGTQHRDCYPKFIEYNGTRIEMKAFLYPDIIPFSSGRQLSGSERRISWISVSTGGQYTRHYKLDYTSSSDNGRTLLTGVTEVGSDANAAGSYPMGGTTAPPFRFTYTKSIDYSAQPTATSKSSGVAGSFCPSPGRLSRGDFNGDGLTDLLCQRATESWVALNRWNSRSGVGDFAQPSLWGPSCPPGKPFGIVDFDGDGDDDVWCNEATFTVLKSSGVYLNKGSHAPPLAQSNSGFVGVADVDGNGVMDVWVHSRDTGLLYIQRFRSQSDSISTVGSEIHPTFCQLGLVGTADFDGDGRSDFFCHRGGVTHVSLARPSTTSLGPLRPWGFGWCTQGTLGSGDFNGDGKADLFCHSQGSTWVGFSNGGTALIGVDHPPLTGHCGDGQSMGAADVDGNGFDDFWCHSNGEINVAFAGGVSYLSYVDGNSTYAPRSALRTPTRFGSCATTATLGAGDFTADGKADFFCGGFGGEVNVRSTGTGLMGDLLSRVEVLGGTTEIQYVSSTQWQKAPPPGAGVPGNRVPPLATVLSKSEKDGRGQVSTIAYEYSGGLYDKFERQFLGFKTAKETHPSFPLQGVSGVGFLTIQTTFDLDYAFLSLPRTITQSVNVLQSGAWVPKPLKTISYAYDKKTVAPFRADLTGEDVVFASGAAPAAYAVPAKTTRATYQYDAYGNRKATFLYGDKDVTGDEKTITHYFPANTTKYIVGIATEENVFAGIGTAGAKLNQTLTFFDNATSVTTPISVGNRTEELKLLQPGNSYVRTRASFESNGNLATQTDELGVVTRYEYDPTYRIFQTKMTRAVGQPEQQVTTTAWNVRCAAPEVQSDANGLATRLAYDALCRETSRTMPGGNYRNTVYVSFGSPTEQHVRTETPGPNGGHLWTRTYFDGLGRTYKTVSAGPSASQDIVTLTSYDARGNVAATWGARYAPAGTGTDRKREFSYDALNQPETVYGLGLLSKSQTYNLPFKTVRFDEMGRRTDVSLDAYGRVVRRREYSPTAPTVVSGGVTATAVSATQVNLSWNANTESDLAGYKVWRNGVVLAMLRGNVTTYSDAGLSASTSYSYQVTAFDTAGNESVKSAAAVITTPAVGGGGLSFSDTVYAYDARGNLASVTDGRGNITRVVIDSLGRKIEMQDPDKGTLRYAFDPASQLVGQTDARGVKTTLVYDKLGRLKSKSVSGGGLPSVVYTNEYDTAATGSFNKGRLVKETHPLGTTSYSYDAQGNVTKEVRVLGGVSYQFVHGYDRAGRKIYTTFPDGSTKGTSAAPVRFDAAGRQLSIPGIVNSVLYDASGTPASIQFANGVSTTRQINPFSGRLDSIRTVNAAGTVLQQLTYNYNVDSTRRSVTSPSAEESWNYTYDGLGRLASARNVGSPANDQTFQWDAIGNLTLNSRRGAYSYPAAPSPQPHAVSRIGTQNFTYDASGNMKTGDGRTYSWDGFGRLSGVVGGGRNLSFSYDAAGARIRTIDTGVTTLTLGGDYEVSGTVATKHFTIGGLLVAKKAGATTQWLHVDGLQSVNVVTDAAGNEVQRLKYRPFGEVLRQTTSQSVPRSYTSERRDSTGLMYLNARYYDPALGRFISPDSAVPSPEAVALNRYAYAKNDPINFTDRNGNSWLMDLGSSLWSGFTSGLNSFGSYAFGSFGGAGFGAANQVTFEGFNPSCFNCMGHGNLNLNLNPTASGSSSGGSWLGSFARGVASNSGLIHLGWAAYNIGASFLSGVNYIGGLAQQAWSGNLDVTTINPQRVTESMASSMGRGGLTVGAEKAAARAAIRGETGGYLMADAPKQVHPGVSTLDGYHLSDKGIIQPWRAHYDDFGRLVGRTDYNAGNRAQNIPDVHHHLYDWTNFHEPGKEIGSHIPGEFKP